MINKSFVLAIGSVKVWAPNPLKSTSNFSIKGIVLPSSIGVAITVPLIAVEPYSVNTYPLYSPSSNSASAKNDPYTSNNPVSVS